MRAASASTAEVMVSMRVTVMAVTLVALCVLATNTHAEITGFSLQRSGETCPIRAIIFHTTKGRRCANPTQIWVMEYVSRIENLAKKKSVLKTYRRHDSDQGGYCSSVSPKVDQKPKSRPKQSLTAAPDKIITDGSPPVKFCKW